MGDLTAAERRRNRIGADLLLVHQDHPLRPWLEANCPAVQPEEEDGDAKRTKLVNEFDMLAWPFVGHKPAPQPVTMKELPTDVFTPPAPLQGLAFASPMQVCVCVGWARYLVGLFFDIFLPSLPSLRWSVARRSTTHHACPKRLGLLTMP